MLQWINAIHPAKKIQFWDGCRNRMMKISLQLQLIESSKLQDHKQQSCMIRNMTVESVGSSGHHVKMNVDSNRQSTIIPEWTYRHVWRCSTMKTLTDQWTHFEQNKLSHWEPMEVVVHGAGNTIELSLSSDELCHIFISHLGQGSQCCPVNSGRKVGPSATPKATKYLWESLWFPNEPHNVTYCCTVNITGM